MGPWTYHQVERLDEDGKKTTLLDEEKTLLDEEKTLLQDDGSKKIAKADTRTGKLPIVVSSILNITLSVLLVLSIIRPRVKDPTLGIWCKYFREESTMSTS